MSIPSRRLRRYALREQVTQRLYAWDFDLEDMGVPLRGRSLDVSIPSAERPQVPGDDWRALQARNERTRLWKQVDELVGRSERYIKGIEHAGHPEELPHSKVPRCPSCREKGALGWEYCAWCGEQMWEGNVRSTQRCWLRACDNRGGPVADCPHV